MKRVIPVAVVFAIVLSPSIPCRGSSSRAAVPQKGSHRVFSRDVPVLPGVIVVKFKPGVIVPGQPALARLGNLGRSLTGAGVESISRTFAHAGQRTGDAPESDEIGLDRIFYARIPEGLDPREAAGVLSAQPDVEYAEPKFIRFIQDTPNDPEIAKQNAALTRLNVFQGWSLAKGDSHIVIATVDGGTNWQHEDLIANVWINSPEDINRNGRFDAAPAPAGDEDGIDQDGNGFVDDVVGWNFANGTNNPRGITAENAEHGTNTASIFGARTDNGLGMAGSSWNCRLMPVCAGGTQDYTIAYGYEGIAYAFQKGAKVINCSWGGTAGFSFFEQDVINAATQAGALVVVSSGNGTNNNGSRKNNDLVHDYPANYRNVLAVGATGSTSDALASFSNYGLSVQVYAPGVSILGASNTGGYVSYNSGTSYSSPLVAGLAGILKSKFPDWSPSMIAAQLRVTADSIDYSNVSLAGNLGRGRVNLARAVSEFNHAGIDVVSASFLNTKGRSAFLPGDTIVATIIVRNVLSTTASNFAFSLTSSDPAVTVLQGTATVSAIPRGEQRTLTGFKLAVGSVSSSKDVIIRAEWVSNTADRDAYAFKVTLFPSVPFWSTQSSPTQNELYSTKAVSRNVAWACGGNGIATDPVVVRTTNGGKQWTNVTGNLRSADLYCIFALDTLRAWVGTGSGKMFATTNGGTTWSEQSYPGTQSPFINGIFFVSATTGYALGDPPSNNPQWVILKTTNGGLTWAHLTNEPLAASTEAGWNNSFCWTDGNHGWFGTNQNKIWRTADGGATWSFASAGGLNSFAVSFKDNAHGIAGLSTGGVVVSSDGGVNWKPAANPSSVGITGAAFIPGTSSAWVASYASPYRSTDNGSTWTSQSFYPFSGDINHLSFADTSIGWIVTSSGDILLYDPSLVTGVEHEPGASLPVTTALHQNYPNPFNPTTTITYRIASGGRVELRIFDLLGREVRTLVDAVQEPGDHEVEFHSGNIPSGVYLYQLRTREHVETRKLVVLK